jgi:ankyrin repeat protein
MSLNRHGPIELEHIQKQTKEEDVLPKSGHTVEKVNFNYEGIEKNDSPAGFNAFLKYNKHGDPQLSELEVAFSAVWKKFLGNLTAQYNLVTENDKNTNEKKTIGLLSQAINGWKVLESTPDGIPRPFAEAVSQEDHDRLMKDLARVLVMCYCLEEDDLHRNNIGIGFDEKGRLRIMKIDHDMSLYQSISSTLGNRRIYHVNEERFVISPKDIEEFPVLHDANIHYWPTKMRVATGSPGYDWYTIKWFEDLSKNKVFRDAANEAFFEFVNTDPEALRKELNLSLGNTRPDMTNLIVNALIKRQGEIRFYLYANRQLGTWLLKRLKENPDDHQKLDPNDLIHKLQEGDNALHVALRTNHFQHLNLDAYKQDMISSFFYNVDLFNGKNNKGETPLMLAIQSLDARAIEGLLEKGARITGKELQTAFSQLTFAENLPENLKQTFLSVKKCLIEYKADENINMTEILKNEMSELNKRVGIVNQKQIVEEFNSKRGETNIIKLLEARLLDIDSNINLGLPEKKEAAVQCFRAAERLIDSADDLERMLALINNNDASRFIRQIQGTGLAAQRSRGKYAVTATEVIIREELNNLIERLIENRENVDEWRDRKDVLIGIRNKNDEVRNTAEYMAVRFVIPTSRYETYDVPTVDYRGPGK